MARYEVRSGNSMLSSHRTRQAAIDAWREKHAGVAVRIVRTFADGAERLVVEGTWHSDDVADNALTR